MSQILSRVFKWFLKNVFIYFFPLTHFIISTLLWSPLRYSQSYTVSYLLIRLHHCLLNSRQSPMCLFCPSQPTRLLIPARDQRDRLLLIWYTLYTMTGRPKRVRLSAKFIYHSCRTKQSIVGEAAENNGLMLPTVELRGQTNREGMERCWRLNIKSINEM